jgi:hypothetical protein
MRPHLRHVARKQFLMISTNPKAAETAGLKIRVGIFCFMHRSDLL